MNFGRVNTGALSGFLASAVSGPVYALLLVIAPFGGDVLGVDVSIDSGLLLGLPLVLLFGVVVAGLPSILLGMSLGASIGERPMTAGWVTFAVCVGAVGGAAVLQSFNDASLTAAVALRGGMTGGLTGYAWTRLYLFLRNRMPLPTPTAIDDEPS